jgi:uncharacterized protein YfbU (UPF0304 family)
MATERFEMRIDSELLDRLDSWRFAEEDTPSRAEAVRRLIEVGLAPDNRGPAPSLTDGEKLITSILIDVAKGLGVETQTNLDLVRSVIYGGHYWALGWEMPGIFHGHVDRRSRVSFVVDVLDMWEFLEEAFEKLDPDEREKLEIAAKPFGNAVIFRGFDGNNESEYLGIARFLVEDLSRFSRFRNRDGGLNSHYPTIDTYSRMLQIFEGVRKTLGFGRQMSVDQMADVLNARKAK